MLRTVTHMSGHWRCPLLAAVIMCVISSYSIWSHLCPRACYLQVLLTRAFFLLRSPYLWPWTDVNSIALRWWHHIHQGQYKTSATLWFAAQNSNTIYSPWNWEDREEKKYNNQPRGWERVGRWQMLRWQQGLWGWWEREWKLRQQWQGRRQTLGQQWQQDGDRKG